MTNDPLPPWAHVRIDPATGRTIPHPLDEHLLEVARRAREGASPGAADWAWLAGLWHDLGKFRIGFRRYIRQVNGVEAHVEGRVKDPEKTHSAAGALWAEHHLTERFGPQGALMARVLQYVIAGHHAGLDNWDSLAKRLADPAARKEFQDALDTQPPSALLRPQMSLPSLASIPFDDEGKDTPGRFALWVRMLFSALVDADFLDTEAFLDAGRHLARGESPTVAPLQPVLADHLQRLAASARDTPVNRLRADVLRQCREKACCPPGVFTLAVPTGGGKTLSSLAFALDHAVAHGKRRVIYAIPYTSIIEQTADVFRGVFAPSLGDDAVIEHHGNAETEPDRETSRSRLACENWDAPLVVTTNVQFFESLFARRTSRCRKLHNIADSVVVLDEAQLLPVEFLQPVVDVLRLLVSDHGVTLVLCTATQPELGPGLSTDVTRGLRRGFGKDRITDIIDDAPKLYAALERVRVHRPASLETPRTWPDLADELTGHEAVLAIVNRRADARELFRLLRQRTGDDGGCRHLSALMCAQHRSDVIAGMKSALKRRREALASGEAAPAVRVVSTQLIECGVDASLPVVYRAMAGLDSIAQAAGRCNREGELPGLGDVHVFVPPTEPPPGLLRQARDACKAVWSQHPAVAPLDLSLFGRYFQRLYNTGDLDTKRVCDDLLLQFDLASLSFAVRFRDVADKVRLIDDKDGATVLVRYRSPGAKDDIDVLLGLLEREGPSRWLMRKLQRYGVTVYRHQVAALVAAGDIREVASCPGLHVQTAGVERFYDPLFGANVDGAPGDPAAYFAG